MKTQFPSAVTFLAASLESNGLDWPVWLCVAIVLIMLALLATVCYKERRSREDKQASSSYNDRMFAEMSQHIRSNPTTSASEKSEANECWQRAIKLADEGNESAAIREFLKAIRIRPHYYMHTIAPNSAAARDAWECAVRQHGG